MANLASIARKIVLTTIWNPTKIARVTTIIFVQTAENEQKVIAGDSV